MPDEHTAPILRELFVRKAAGGTWLELARWLDQVAPKPDGRHWARSSVEFMIGCRTYLGELRHGENIHAGAHEAIVPAGLWTRAQNAPGRRTPRGSYLLSGLVLCSGCGRRMQGTSGTRQAPRYACVTHGCPARHTTITASRLNDEVVAEMFQRLGDFHAQAVDDDELEQVRDEVERLTGEVERLASVVPSHPVAVAAHQRALSDAEAALSDAEYQLELLTRAQSEAGPDVRELRRNWPTFTLAEQREILRSGIDVVLVRRSSSRTTAARILVFSRGEAPAELLNGRRPLRSFTWDDHPGSPRLAFEDADVGASHRERDRI